LRSARVLRASASWPSSSDFDFSLLESWLSTLPTATTLPEMFHNFRQLDVTGNLLWCHWP
jgi:hypothetical protein